VRPIISRLRHSPLGEGTGEDDTEGEADQPGEQQLQPSASGAEQPSGHPGDGRPGDGHEQHPDGDGASVDDGDDHVVEAGRRPQDRGRAVGLTVCCAHVRNPS
jgi:hypothetical protein